MLEVVIPGMRYGEAKINSSSAYRGTFCFIAGVDASGYQLLQSPYTTAQAAKALYPVNKYYFEEDLNDTSDAVDKLTKGDTIVYYDGGEYITDKFDQASLGLTAAYWNAVESGLSSSYGKKLYVPGSSTAIGTTGLDKLYVSTGAAYHGGILFGDTSFSAGVTKSDCYVGFAVGVYYEDSANAKLRFRIMPSRNAGPNF